MKRSNPDTDFNLKRNDYVTYGAWDRTCEFLFP